MMQPLCMPTDSRCGSFQRNLVTGVFVIIAIKSIFCWLELSWPKGKAELMSAFRMLVKGPGALFSYQYKFSKCCVQKTHLSIGLNGYVWK